ncbi:MAG: hypothetical protein CVV64_02670 [Candidatus Wallbacteria bacterium HGW-Wallbacteria-1]|jgi:tRNA A-37 threonylcarbamoyl transferase component Bud32|uniref:Protein kinase domain-containing protein n=1 Tax=Candidatus Wallbacteria bacterium HGW-Wallbacteria-1 TaxID=2013854 RepID=A0A2N1PTD3_9BACT|nr:MAG: hypothetical protein CVV64_02670 [Candidatus Wallbacteria bacterium HGW-Wallbacteria-1]
MIKQLGRYKITKLIAAGGMARVFHCEDITGELKNLAAKIPMDFVLSQPQYLKRFENEGKISMKFKHPNIIAVHDAGTFEGTPYMVMDFIDGKSLEDIEKERGRIPLKESLQIIKALCRAIAYMHNYRDEDITSSIVHRDLSPQNTVIRNDGRVLLMDFGIAKSASLTSVTMGTATIGKPYYMAPEQIQAKNSDAIDKRADIYAVGVILYEMLTAAKPYEGTNPFQVMEKVRNPKVLPTPAHEIEPSIPPGISEIIMRAMHKNRNQRFQHIEEMLKALEKGEDTSEAKRMTRTLAMLGTLSALMISSGIAGLLYTDKLDHQRRLSMCLAPVSDVVRTERIPISGETLAQHRIRLTTNGKAFETISDAGGKFRFEEIPLQQGDNVLRLALYDTSGNFVHRRNAPLTVRYDSIKPSAPLIHLLPTQSSEPALTIHGSAEERTGIIARKIKPENATEKMEQQVRTDEKGSYNLKVTLSEGENIWSMICRDPAGNTSEATEFKIVGDRSAPAAPNLMTPLSPRKPGPISLFGKSEPYAMVAMSAGSLSMTAESDCLGTFAFQDVNLAPGEYTLAFKTIDTAGNHSVNSMPGILKIQPNAPQLPFPILERRHTSNPEMVISGSYIAGEKITVTHKGVSSEISCDDKGRFNMPVSLDNGLNEIVFQTPDMKSGIPVLLILDRDQPEPPAADSTTFVTTSNTISIQGRAEPFSSVTLKSLWTGKTSRAGQDGNFSIELSDIPEGDHTVSLNVTDMAGNTSSPAEWVVIRDLTTPSILLDPIEKLTRMESISICGSTEPNALVRASSGSRIQIIRADENGLFRLPNLSLEVGSNVLSITSTDRAGNVGLPGETVEISLDVTPPPIPEIEPLPSRLNTSRIVTMKGRTEPGARILAIVLCPSAKSENTEGGSDELLEYRRSETLSNDKGEFVMENLKLNVGENQIRVMSLDTAGNESPSAPVMVVMVDLALPPSPEFVDFPEYTAEKMIAFKVRTQPGMSARGTVNGVSSEALSDSAGIALISGMPLTEGRNRVEIVALDESGLESPENYGEIILDLVKPTPPTLVDVPGRVDKPSLTIDGKAEADCSIVINVNGSTSETSPDSEGNFKFLGIKLKEGINRIFPLARDRAGNMSDPGTTFKIILDTVPPDPPRLVDIPNITETDELTVSGIAEAGSKVTLLINEESHDVNVGSSGNFTTTLRLHEGQNTITATARDEVGNESKLSETFQITCSIPPDPPVFKDLPEIVTKPALDLAGIAEMGAIVKIHAGDSVVECKSENGQFSTRIDLLNGSNLIWAEAVDSFGNVSKPTRTFNVSYEKVAFIEMDTTPSGATVMIGSDKIGITPLKNATVPPGPIRLELRKEGYRTKILEKNYAVGDTESLSLDLEQLMLPITIDSDPPGADLYLDSTLLGRTPYKADAVAAGTHQIVLRLANHMDRSERIELTETGTTTFSFEIQPILGQLNIDCEVDGAKVFINNQQMGETPLGRIDLPYGQHMILIQKSGYAAFRRKVTIESPVEVDVKVIMNRLQYKIEIICSEEGAKVIRDGQLMGKTPLPPFEVPDVGEFSIRVEKDGFRPFVGKVDIFETGITPKNIRLIKAQALIVERDDRKDKGQSRLTYDDKNNDFWLAKNISLNKEFSNVLELSKGDSTDWWKVTFDSSGYLYLTLEGKANLQLFRDDQANQIQISGNSASRIQMDSGSTLYLKITGEGDADVDYRITASFRAHSTGDGF